jgi:hypothetical protein
MQCYPYKPIISAKIHKSPATGRAALSPARRATRLKPETQVELQQQRDDAFVAWKLAPGDSFLRSRLYRARCSRCCLRFPSAFGSLWSLNHCQQEPDSVIWLTMIARADFHPKVLDQRLIFTDYETFDAVIARANEWIAAHGVNVISVETLMLPGKKDDEAGVTIMGNAPTTLRQSLRVWYELDQPPATSTPTESNAQNIKPPAPAPG